MPSRISAEPLAPQRVPHGTAAKEFSKPAYMNSGGVGGQPILIPSPKTPQKKGVCVCVCVCVCWEYTKTKPIYILTHLKTRDTYRVKLRG